jgi:hypothetical protein
LTSAESSLRKAEKRHATLNAELDGLVGSADHVELARVGAALADAAAALGAAEEDWLLVADELEQAEAARRATKQQ